MRYKINTTGRQSKAIGVIHPFEEEVEAAELDGKPDWDAIRTCLYEGRTKSGKAWEHIGRLKATRHNA